MSNPTIAELQAQLAAAQAALAAAKGTATTPSRVVLDVTVRPAGFLRGPNGVNIPEGQGGVKERYRSKQEHIVFSIGDGKYEPTNLTIAAKDFPMIVDKILGDETLRKLAGLPTA